MADNKTSKKSKLSLILFIDLIAALIIIVVIFAFKGKNNPVENNEEDFDYPIMIVKNDKYGFINNKGDIVIEPKYEMADHFVSKYTFGFYYDENGKKISEIIDTEGNTIMSFDKETNIGLFDNNWFIDNKIYDLDLKQLSDDNLVLSPCYSNYNYYIFKDINNKQIGIIDNTGKITYKTDFDDIDLYFYLNANTNKYLKDDYCLIKTSNEDSIIVNCKTGVEVLRDDTNSIRLLDSNTFVVEEKNTENFIKYFYVQDDKVVAESNKENSEFIYSPSGYIFSSLDDGTIYINVSTGEITKEEPKDIKYDNYNEWEAYTGIRKEYKDGKYKLTKDGKDITGYDYDYFEYLDLKLYKLLEKSNKKYALGRKNYDLCIINLEDGSVVKTFKDSYYSSIYDSTFIRVYSEKNELDSTYYNLYTGKEVQIANMYGYGTYNSLIIEDDGYTKYYNMDCELIYKLKNKKVEK